MVDTLRAPMGLDCCFTCRHERNVEGHPFVSWCSLRRELVSVGARCDEWTNPKFDADKPAPVTVQVIE